MATDNSTTTPSIAGSSSLLSTNSTTSLSNVLITSTTNSPSTKSTDAGRSSDVWTTSTITFVTVDSTPTTSTLTTIIRISGASSLHSSSFRSLTAVDPLTTETATEGVPKSENTSTGSTISDGSKSQRQPSTPVLVVIGLVVASFIAGIFFLLFRCRRRLRLPKRKVEHVLNRRKSCLSFLDSDPFVSLPPNRPAMRLTGDEDQRGKTHPVLEAMMSNWGDFESVGHEAFVFDPVLCKPRSLDNDSAILSSQYGTQRASPCLPTTYPSILFEQDGVICGEGPSLERYETDKNLHETPTFIPISRPPPPPSRPPRSPRRKSKRSDRHSFDSVSTAHSSSAPLLYRTSPEDRLEEFLYRGTTPLNVQKKSDS